MAISVVDPVISWYGSGCESGSSDLYLCQTDPDADPGVTKTYGLYGYGSGSGTLVKSQKKSRNSRNQSFSYYFCLTMEGSGAGAGFVLLTNGSGSGSGRPKNIRIRVHNTWMKSGDCEDLMCVQDGCVEPLPRYHRPEVTLGEIWRCLRPSRSGRRIDTKNRGYDITVTSIAIYGPMIYTAPYVMLLMRANPLRGEVGGGWALEIKPFLGPVKCMGLKVGSGSSGIIHPGIIHKGPQHW